jgi:hypothetical protein
VRNDDNQDDQSLGGIRPIDPIIVPASLRHMAPTGNAPSKPDRVRYNSDFSKVQRQSAALLRVSGTFPRIRAFFAALR